LPDVGQGDHALGRTGALTHLLYAAFEAFSFHATAQLPLIHHLALYCL